MYSMSCNNTRLMGGTLMGVGCGIMTLCLSVNYIKNNYIKKGNNIDLRKCLNFNCFLGGSIGFFTTKYFFYK